jgi:hypothetical protein
MDQHDLTLPGRSRQSLARAAPHHPAPELLGERVDALPGIERLRAACREARTTAYLAGPAVRDLLIGRVPETLAVRAGADLGDALGFDAYRDPSSELILEADGRQYRVARLRRSIAEEIECFHFTIDAFAVSLTGEPILIASPTGLQDLERFRLRLLSAAELERDPALVIRAARYLAELGLRAAPDTASALRAARLERARPGRVEAEMLALARSDETARALALLESWGLAELAGPAGLMVDRARELIGRHPWYGLAEPAEAVLTAVGVMVPGGPGRWAEGAAHAAELAREVPAEGGAAIELLAGRSGAEVVAARAVGAEWIDACIEDLRALRMRISIDELRAVGLPNEPAVSRALRAVMAAQLEGGAEDRESQLLAALLGSSARRIRPH